MLRWVDRLARWGISSVFLLAGIPKLFQTEAFAATIAAYAILPEVLVPPVAVLLPTLEVALAIGLLFNTRVARIGSVILLVLFIALLVYAISVGLDIDCGCFGPKDPEYTAFHGLREALVRDIVMLMILGYSFWYQWYRHIIITTGGETVR